MYLYKNSGFEVNHIHGKLGNDLNHIIFGYGDEMDDDYKTISKLNDNDYLTNIKSIRYLETDKYRKLLRFISSIRITTRFTSWGTPAAIRTAPC